MQFLNDNRKIIATVLFAIELAMAIIGFIMFPDPMGVQVGNDGQISSTLPKIVGILIPMVFAVSGVYMCWTKTDRNWRYLFLSAIGIILYAFEFLINLR